MQRKNNFESYMVETLKRIAAGQPYDKETWETRMTVFMQLISDGVDPEKARRTMSMYWERGEDMTEEDESVEDLQRGLYRELIEIAKRLGVQVEKDIKTGHIKEAWEAGVLAFKVKEFAARFRER